MGWKLGSQGRVRIVPGELFGSRRTTARVMTGWLAFSCGIALGLSAPWALAQPEPSNALTGEAPIEPARSERAVVVLYEPLELEDGLRQRVRRAVTSELSELRVRVEWVAAAPVSDLTEAVVEARGWARSQGAAAVVWLEVSERGWRVFLFEPRGPHLRQRRIGAASSEAATEELAVVLRSALTAIVEGIEAGMSEVVLETAPPKPEPSTEAAGIDATYLSPSVPRQTLLALGGVYTGSAYTDEGPWENGGALVLQLRPERGSVFLALSHGVLSPLVIDREVSGARVRTRVRRRPTELFAGVELGKDALRWGPEVGVVADFVRRESLGAEAPFLATTTSSRWQIAGSARVRGTWFLVEGVGVSSSLGADFLVAPVRHVVDVEGSSVLLLRQAPIRPRLEMGVFVQLW